MSARAMGAGLVLATEPNANRAARAEGLGVDEVLPVGDEFEDRIQSLTGGVGVDSAIECSGTEAGLSACVTAVRSKGTVIQVGLHTGLPSVDPMQWCLKDLSIEATWAYPVHVWPRVGRLVASGRLPIERIVTTRTTLDQVVEAGFERLIDPSGGETKVLIKSIA
jgi:(R,R)-butanediol dehydrogenase / meso-butanediol dehydrogenase / diacetyl reductase